MIKSLAQKYYDAELMANILDNWVPSNPVGIIRREQGVIYFKDGSKWVDNSANGVVVAPKPITLTFHSDPGHGWLEAPIDLIEQYDLQNQITKFSYMKGKIAFLEEDQDSALLTNKLKSDGYQLNYKEKNSQDNESKIRSYSSFDPQAFDYNKELNIYRVEVLADDSGKWCGNALKFESIPLAQDYGLDLFSRWISVKQWRVINDDNEVKFETNY